MQSSPTSGVLLGFDHREKENLFPCKRGVTNRRQDAALWEFELSSGNSAKSLIGTSAVLP